jgi:hypothetical protein
VTERAPGEVVIGVAFSPDGRRIAIARQHQVGWIGPSRLMIVRRSDWHQHRLRVGKLVSLPDWQPLPRG